MPQQSPTSAPPSGRDSVQVTETAVLAALANPTRARIIDVLTVHGPGTASLLAERIGAAIGSISHHLKVLASVGLVVDVPELAKDRRERWWRAATDGFRWTTSDFADDPVAASAEAAAAHQNLQRQFERTRDWLATPLDDTEDRTWSDAAYSTQTWLTLSAEELAQVSKEITQVLARWHKRTVPDDGADRRTVFAFSRAFPCQP